MPATVRIGITEVKKLTPNGILYDSAVAGFCARRQKSPTVTYYVFYRTEERRQRWFKIGRHGSPWTPDQARAEAKRILGLAVAGQDPAADRQETRTGRTVTELCDVYLAAVRNGDLLTRRGQSKKATTLATDTGRIETHIKPLLGKLRVASVTRRDIEDFQNAVAAGKTARRVKLDKARAVSNVRGGRGTATRTMGLLGAVFEFAVARGWRKDNPVRGIRRAADGRRERRLTDDEFKKLGAALAAAAEKAKVWPPAIAAIRFLAVTGWRRGEALDLTHDAVDVGKRIAVLADTKTGRSVRPLSQAAVDVIRAQTVEGDLVFPASRGEGTLSGFQKYWQRIVHAGGLPADVTAHVLRHSFASVAADLGYSEATIANLIGHRGHSITSRYIHSADALLLAAADAVAGRIMELMQ